MVAVLFLLVANDGWYQGTGSEQPFGAEHGSIQMVREHVHIELYSSEAKVRVQFEFKNHGEATTVTMAFPESGYNMDGLSAFRSEVDGRHVPTERRVIETDNEDEYKGVWVKDVSFAKGQTRTVVNTYTQALSGNTAGALGFDYIFSTGASWFKRIDEIRVTYDFSKCSLSQPFPAQLFERGRQPVTPTVTGTASRKIVWREVEPDFTLGLHMVHGFWKVEVNGLLIPPYVLSSAPTGSPQDLLVAKYSIAHVFGEHGRFEDGGQYGWRSGVRVRWDERQIMFVGDSQIQVDGELKRLSRPIEERKVFASSPGGPTAEYVYLRDVVEALGGTYRYDPKYDKVYINVPSSGPRSLM